MTTLAWELTEDLKIAVGRMVVDRAKNNLPFPTDPKEGLQLLMDLGLDPLTGITGVKFHQSEFEGIMHIALPPSKAVVERVEEIEQQQGGAGANPAYSPPSFYVDFNDDSVEGQLKMFEFRLGDYVITHCG